MSLSLVRVHKHLLVEVSLLVRKYLEISEDLELTWIYSF